jgi:hypothetical protein
MPAIGFTAGEDPNKLYTTAQQTLVTLEEAGIVMFNVQKRSVVFSLRDC